MNLFYLTLELLTGLAIFSALAVITSTNPVIAIIFLILLFVNAALYLIFIGLNFIGISYLIVYIGAITVLFLFIIMMISTEIMKTVEVGSEFSKLLPLAYTLAVLFLTLFVLTIPTFLTNFSAYEIYLLFHNFTTTIWKEFAYILTYFNGANPLSSLSEDNVTSINQGINEVLNSNLLQFKDQHESLFFQNLQIQTLGQAIYGKNAIILILASFLLLLAMVCPIILSRKTSLPTNQA